IVGVTLILAVLEDAFEAIVLPRRVTRPYRLARLYYRAVWRIWIVGTRCVPSTRYGRSLLGVFGPLSLLCLFVCWALALVFGFGLLQHAFAPNDRSLAESLYLSG